MKITENEIRPDQIFQEYLRLAEIDTRNYFSTCMRVSIDCPACGAKGAKAFTKVGFDYEECGNCKTIFVSPRPVKEAFDAYYTDSPSTEYWATTFYKETEKARREKLWKPKAVLVKNLVDRFQGDGKVKYIVDIGGGYGIFDEEIRQIMEVTPLVIEPSVHLAQICRDKGIEVIEKFMEDIVDGELPQGRKCFVSFELFEHLHNPATFLETVIDRMDSGDLFIFTTLSSMGIDVQGLREHHTALSPPHHLNFLNPKSVGLLLEKIGFEVLDSSTPGKLDIDILIKNKSHIKDSFIRNFLEYLNSSELEEFQALIAGIGLSSHMMITCKKP